MGRLKKYFTEEEKREAIRAAVRKYYWKNKEACDNRSKINYHKNVKRKKDGESLSDNLTDR